MKNFSRTCLLMFAAALPWQAARAVDCTGSACKVEVQFQGTYLEETCDVSINDGGSSEVVQLPTLSAKSLASAGDEAGSVVFRIALKNCPVNRSIDLRFISGATEADGDTGNLVNKPGNDYSQNAQIRIRRSDMAQMSINDPDSVQNYQITSTGDDVSHDYLASYFAKRAASAGLVSATANIDLIYK